MNEQKPLLSFGLITDTQYVDLDDAWDFHHIQERHYRGVLDVAQRAVAEWKQRDIRLVLQLGDLIDGKNVTDKSFADDGGAQKALAFKRMNDALSFSMFEYEHLIGNHELYCWSRDELNETVFGSNLSYRALSPHPQLKIILLDAYIVSCLNQGDAAGNEASFALLEKHNPNDVRGLADWVKGLVGTEQRWLPYNGAFGDAQLAFLRSELQDCVANKQRAIVCTHVPVGPGSSQDMCLTWDYKEVLAILNQFQFENSHGELQPAVLAVFNGHDHDGGESVLDGIVHRTFKSPLICKSGEDAFSVIELYEDRLEVCDLLCTSWFETLAQIVGFGIEASKTIKF